MMWFAGVIYLAASLAFWEFAHAVFIPELLTNRVLELFSTPVGSFVRLFVSLNVSGFYFAVYFLFSLYWPKLHDRFRNIFFGSLALFAVNVLILFPLAGKGFLGYLLPQGYIPACTFLFVAHWIFARALQIQERWLRPFDKNSQTLGVRTDS
jgi:hypothetical protein